MIIYHQNNVAGFAGNHIWYWPLQPLIQLHVRIAVNPGAVTGTLLTLPRYLRGGFNPMRGGFSS